MLTPLYNILQIQQTYEQGDTNTIYIFSLHRNTGVNITLKLGNTVADNVTLGVADK